MIPALFAAALAAPVMSDDLAKAPCVFSMVRPATFDTDPLWVEVKNATKTALVAPVIDGFCSPGYGEVVDAYGVMTAVIDPRHASAGRLIIVPVITPGQVVYVHLPAPEVAVGAAVFYGPWTVTIPMQITPGGFVVNLLDDDLTVDAGDHIYAGRCRTQTGVTVGIHRRIEYGGSCSAAELARSR